MDSKKSQPAAINAAQTKSENPLPKILPGTICQQMVKCKKPRCKCADGFLHGPYFYWFFREGKTLRKRYVKAAEVKEYQRACRAYQRQRLAQRLERRFGQHFLQGLVVQLTADSV